MAFIEIPNPFVGPMVLRQGWRPRPMIGGPTSGGVFTSRLVPTSCFGVRRLNGNYSGSCVRRQTPSVSYGFSGSDFDLATYVSDVGSGNGTLDLWYDQSGNGRNMTVGTQTGAIRNASTTYTVGGKAAIRSLGEAFVHSAVSSILLTTTAATILWAGQVDTPTRNNSDPSTNGCAVRDNLGYTGLGFTSAGSAQAWAFDTNYDTAAQAYTSGRFVAAAWRHGGGVLQINVNGAGWVTAAGAGATGSLAGSLSVGFVDTMRHLEFATFNTALSDADVAAWGAETTSYYGATWGSTALDPWSVHRTIDRLPYDGPADRYRHLRG